MLLGLWLMIFLFGGALSALLCIVAARYVEKEWDSVPPLTR
jgi:hypothetical protein